MKNKFLWIALLASLFSPIAFATPGQTSCPDGFQMIGNPGEENTFCISKNINSGAMYNSAVDFNRAQAACVGIQAHLCSPAEWSFACTSQLVPGLGKVWEWVNEVVPAGQACGLGGYNGQCAYIVGGGTCDAISSGQISYDRDDNNYRCCR